MMRIVMRKPTKELKEAFDLGACRQRREMQRFRLR